MKTTLIALAALTGAMTVAACDGPSYDQDDSAPPPVDAQAAGDAGVEVAAPEAAPSPTDTPPVADQGTLPPDTKSSEESVQPESETLFY
ncbi:MAG: hypothetical protein EON90_04095 [Brevundimonas sp.]|nr:MAG: hypothetical protein EON90_04095 [Brevundimonas sp.]